MGGKSTFYYYERRIKTLKKRRDMLDQRIAQSDKDLSYDKAETSAINWALAVVEAHPEYAMDLIREEKVDKIALFESGATEESPNTPKENNEVDK